MVILVMFNSYIFYFTHFYMRRYDWLMGDGLSWVSLRRLLIFGMENPAEMGIFFATKRQGEVQNVIRMGC